MTRTPRFWNICVINMTMGQIESDARSSIKQQKQRNEGRFQALEYFGHTKKETLTWAAVLFNDGKVNSYDANDMVSEYLCHLDERCTK